MKTLRHLNGSVNEFANWNIPLRIMLGRSFNLSKEAIIEQFEYLLRFSRISLVVDYTSSRLR